MVSILDILGDLISAVYTFMSLIQKAVTVATASVRQFEQSKILKLPFVYLGYWIKDSRKMNYKSNYKPAPLVNGAWTPHNPLG